MNKIAFIRNAHILTPGWLCLVRVQQVSIDCHIQTQWLKVMGMHETLIMQGDYFVYDL